jgi:MFS transporter, DHA1 family, staphyloferrin A biosynthesis exporter
MERTTTAWLALSAVDAGSGAVAVGLVLAARTLPSLLLGLAAGTIADQINRTRQLLAVAIAGLLVMAGFAYLVGTQTVQLWQVVVMSLAAGCLQVFDTPARQALVLDTVPRDVAPSAVAFNALAQRLLTGLGAFAAGLLIAASGVASSYGSIALAWAVAASLVVVVHAPRELGPRVSRLVFSRGLLDAARLVLDNPAVRTLTIASIACEVFAFSYMSAVPVFARDVLQAGPDGFGKLNAAAALGGSVAVIGLSLIPGRVRREPLLGGVLFTYAGSLLALSATRDLVPTAAVLVVVGASAAAFDVLQQTLIQLAVPERQRGRAVGVWLLGIGSAPVGHVEMGALCATFGAPNALAFNGSLVLAAAVTLLVRAPTYRWLRG